MLGTNFAFEQVSRINGQAEAYPTSVGLHKYNSKSNSRFPVGMTTRGARSVNTGIRDTHVSGASVQTRDVGHPAEV